LLFELERVRDCGDPEKAELAGDLDVRIARELIEQARAEGADVAVRETGPGWLACRPPRSTQEPSSGPPAGMS
jgi:hypothetical protein